MADLIGTIGIYPIIGYHWISIIISNIVKSDISIGCLKNQQVYDRNWHDHPEECVNPGPTSTTPEAW